MSPDVLIEALAETGVVLGSDGRDRVEEVLEDDNGLFVPLMDDRWCFLPALLAGRTFGHRVTEVEIEHDLLAVAPDLEPILLLSDDADYGRWVNGDPLEIAYPAETERSTARAIPDDALDDAGSLILPPGALAGIGAEPGTLVGLRLRNTDVEVVRIDSTGSDVSQDVIGRHIADLVASDPERPHGLEAVVLTVLADRPDAFVDPLPPLQDLISNWDVDVDGDVVAVPGFDFAMWRIKSRLARLQTRYDLDEDEALAVAAITRLHESVLDIMDAYQDLVDTGDDAAITEQLEATTTSRPPSPDQLGGDSRDRRTVAATLPFLAEPAVAEAVLRETSIGDPARDAAALGLLAETLEPKADREAQPALRWLHAKALEELGHTDEAEQKLREAERLDPTWPPVVVDLARYASDRGDALTGLTLLGRLDDESAPLLQAVLEQHRPAPARSMPRNEPCWCGSGRKFKQCHLRQTDRLPLPERAGWLYQKGVLYVLDTGWNGLVNELGHIRIEHVESEQRAVALIHDGLVMDATLFEGGALEEFVARRGSLLPPDELLLAEQWLLIERSVYEVVATSRGASVSVRDLRTGDLTEVSERTASRELRSGHLVCAHILPTGDGHEFFGGIEPIGLHQRQELIELLDSEPDPEDVVAFLSRRLAPPRLANTEGHSLVMCEAELHTADPSALAAGFDDHYRREDTDEDESSGSSWVELTEIDGMDGLRASLRLEGHRLIIDTNSEERLDAILAIVRSIEPAIALVSQRKEPVPTVRDAARLAEALPAEAMEESARLNDLPEVRAAVAEHMRRYEKQWLDLPVPALDGRTPREAVADPTRRDDVRRLLASFPDTDDPTAMSPNRLRTALGLSPG